MKQTLEPRLGQHLAMTPRMRQAIRLLQLSSTELRDELRELAETNYMLEVEDELPGDAWREGSAPVREGSDSDRFAGPTESLRDLLNWQLHSARLSDTDHLIGTVIIDSVDEHGYLDSSMDELLEALEHLGLRVERDEIEPVLCRIQRFDPPGVAARTLSECLSRQLEETAPETPRRELALTIARDHLETVARGDLAALGRTLRTTREELQGALALLRGLNPRPGADLAGAPTEYVAPDLRVFRSGGMWKVELNPGVAPTLRINTLYAGLVRDGDRGADNLSLRRHLSDARAIIKGLENRARTMVRVARAVFRVQSAFLERGEEAMRPLALRDIASEVGVHESTVSRVTRGKYVQTPRGVFELKYFFSNQVSIADEGATSSAAIRARLRRIIADEAPDRPWSDQRLASSLEQTGFRVARRTVAKYRDSMGIPPSHERRRAGAAGLDVGA